MPVLVLSPLLILELTIELLYKAYNELYAERTEKIMFYCYVGCIDIISSLNFD